MLTEQREKEVQTTTCSKDRTYSQVVCTKLIVSGLLQEEKPMEIDDISPHEGSMHLTPIISFPEEGIL